MNSKISLAIFSIADENKLKIKFSILLLALSFVATFSFVNLYYVSAIDKHSHIHSHLKDMKHHLHSHIHSHLKNIHNAIHSKTPSSFSNQQSPANNDNSNTQTNSQSPAGFSNQQSPANNDNSNTQTNSQTSGDKSNFNDDRIQSTFNL
jgi:hypothetical protein